MTQSLFLPKRSRTTLRKVWAGLLMLSLNFSIGGIGSALLTSQVAHAATAVIFYSDDFESDNLSAWTSSSGSWTTTSNHSLGGSHHASYSASTTNAFGDILLNQISTAGYENISLSYSYKIAAGLESADHVYVEWTIDGSTWQQITDYSAITDGGVNSALFNLPSDAADEVNFAIRFRAVMNAGNDDFRLDDISLSGTAIEVIADTTGPEVIINSPDNDEITGPTGTITYSVGDSDLVTCTLDDVEIACDMSSYTFTQTDGEHIFTITGTDTAGNEGSDSLTWNVDATGPTVTITSGPTPLSHSPDATFVFETEPLALTRCNVDGEASSSCTDSATYQNLLDAVHTFFVTATDELGNTGPTASSIWTISTTPDSESGGEVPPAPSPTPPPGGGGSSTFDYWGCTDHLATNFNPLANRDDNSCQFPGGNESGGTTTDSGSGEVLGAATTEGSALPASCVANPYLRDYLKIGKKNDPEQVKLLQIFLNENMNAGLPVTGFFGSLTKSWVKKFQKLHHAEIIQPWVDAGFGGDDLKEGTGYVYKTTKRYINLLKCSELNDPIPKLVPDNGN